MLIYSNFFLYLLERVWEKISSEFFLNRKIGSEDEEFMLEDKTSMLNAFFDIFPLSIYSKYPQYLPPELQDLLT